MVVVLKASIPPPHLCCLINPTAKVMRGDCLPSSLFIVSLSLGLWAIILR